MYKGPLTHSLHYSEFVELTLNKFLNKQAFKLRSERVITQIRLGFKIPFNKNVAF